MTDYRGVGLQRLYCICMCMHVYLCIHHVCLFVRLYVHTYIRAYVRMYACALYMYILDMCKNIRMCMYSVHIIYYVYMRDLCVCVCTCIGILYYSGTPRSGFI